jgi:hypothetical protein
MLGLMKTCRKLGVVFTHPHFQRIEKWRGC